MSGPYSPTFDECASTVSDLDCLNTCATQHPKDYCIVLSNKLGVDVDMYISTTEDGALNNNSSTENNASVQGTGQLNAGKSKALVLWKTYPYFLSGYYNNSMCYSGVPQQLSPIKITGSQIVTITGL